MTPRQRALRVGLFARTAHQPGTPPAAPMVTSCQSWVLSRIGYRLIRLECAYTGRQIACVVVTLLADHSSRSGCGQYEEPAAGLPGDRYARNPTAPVENGT